MLRQKTDHLLLKCPVLRNSFLILGAFGLASLAAAQQPPVKVNVLNVCSPSPEDQREISSALARIPQKASFSQDFEIDRGRSTLDQSAGFLQAGQTAQMSGEPGAADWVRIRREFPGSSPFSRVQYSFSRDPKSMVETLVFLVRDPADLMQIAIEDSVPAETTPANMLATDTPASRVKLERFGKSSIVLARCSATETGPAPDQSKFEPLFQSASAIAAKYRSLLGVRRMIPAELARIAAAGPTTAGTRGKPEAKKTVPPSKSQ
jgi:hypothetical protein